MLRSRGCRQLHGMGPVHRAFEFMGQGTEQRCGGHTYTPSPRTETREHFPQSAGAPRPIERSTPRRAQRRTASGSSSSPWYADCIDTERSRSDHGKKCDASPLPVHHCSPTDRPATHPSDLAAFLLDRRRQPSFARLGDREAERPVPTGGHQAGGTRARRVSRQGPDGCRMPHQGRASPAYAVAP